jgi:hypothetical protein
MLCHPALILSQMSSSGCLAEDSKNRDMIAKQDGALQQLVLMALNDHEEVVFQTCTTLGEFKCVCPVETPWARP